ILAYTFISLAIFAWEGKVDWTLGLVLAAGTMIGSQVGVHLTVLKGHRWIKKVVTVVVIIMAIKLIIS
ncbi:MAG: TSUP family transporter, partial [Pseudomonadota bacterium]|nr:TSUP family transporter [Pseudomonadota bacterium]